jgi:RNA polymerase sigma factor (sigma-70 family)
MDKETEQRLVLEHQGLVHAQIKSFATNSKIDKNDYYQIGMQALLRAVRRYDSTKAKFPSFAWPIIRNALINAYNRVRKQREGLIEDSGGEPYYTDVHIDDLLPKLTELESTIVKYKIDGYTIKDIATYLDITQKSVKETLNNIYNKIKADND